MTKGEAILFRGIECTMIGWVMLIIGTGTYWMGIGLMALLGKTILTVFLLVLLLLAGMTFAGYVASQMVGLLPWRNYKNEEA